MSDKAISPDILQLLLARGELERSARSNLAEWPLNPTASTFRPTYSSTLFNIAGSGQGQGSAQPPASETASDSSLSMHSQLLLHSVLNGSQAATAAGSFQNRIVPEYAVLASRLQQQNFRERFILDQLQLQQALQDGLASSESSLRQAQQHDPLRLAMNSNSGYGYPTGLDFNNISSMALSEDFKRQILLKLLLEREAGLPSASGQYNQAVQQSISVGQDSSVPLSQLGSQKTLPAGETKVTAPLRAEGKSNKKDKKAGKERPKRAMSAYNIFFKEERQRILATLPVTKAPPSGPQKPLKKGRSHPHGKITFEELARKVSERWHKLSPQEFELYQAKALADKERHELETEEFRLNNTV